ncbi:hypothetical protein QTH90_24785 [Variovorax sp. J2P1-59]|uniref:hypothetical protein n=1 Tax=Variovorax flavidus TaxID=3053501 RepID=UPI002577BEFB|nr:hypothetical protein [Variovorax sp. J2P1-59]MDM0077646.1 hypothetical protein [Variovorax sp. J2P1-59]
MAKSSRALALSNRTSKSAKPKMAAAKQRRKLIAERDHPESAPKFVSIAALVADGTCSNLTDPQRAYECLQSLLSARCRLNGGEELYIEPLELLDVVTVLDAEVVRQLRALRAAIEATREIG